VTRRTDVQTLRWPPYAVAGLLLLVDFALLARALPQVRAGFDYGPWSLQRGLYSDILNLSLRHYLRVGHVIHPLPYVHDRIEYPVLLGFVLWLPSWLPGGPASWLAAAGVVIAAATFGSIHLLGRLRPSARWWIAASPALLLDAAINWDLVGIFFLVAAVVWFAEARYTRSGAAAGLGVCFKLFPVVVAPMALAALGSRWWRSTGDRPGAGDAAADLRRWLVPFAAVCGVVLVPLLLVAPTNTWWFVRFNDIRPPKDSLFGLLGLALPDSVTRSGVANPLSFLVVAAVLLLGAWLVWRLAPEHHGRGVALASAMAVVAWMAVNKIWNPQYVLWVFAAGALASLPAAFGVALGAFSVYDWWFEFHLRLPSRPLAFSQIGQSAVAIRVVLFGAMALWAGRELWRLAPRRADLPAEPAASLR
jgi:hypothetical protein